MSLTFVVNFVHIFFKSIVLKNILKSLLGGGNVHACHLTLGARTVCSVNFSSQGKMCMYSCCFS